MACTSSLSYEQKGFITVPQRSGSIEIHGPDAMTTIYFYVGCSVFFFCIGSYYSIMYIRVRNANRKSTGTIVPETYTLKQVICPSCFKKESIDPSSYLICSNCFIKMEELKEFFRKQSKISENKNSKDSTPTGKKIYNFLYPDFDELSVFLMGFVLVLLAFFNAEFRIELIDVLSPSTSYAKAEPSIVSICLKIGCSLVILAGMVASFIHILIVSEKDDFSLLCMKTFALITLAYIGIKSGLYAFENERFIFMLSPGWNFLMAMACYSGLGMIDEIPFDQADSRFLQTFLSLVLVSIIFYLLNSILQLYWPIIFSICVNYVVCINRGAVNSKFLKLYSIQR